MSVSLLTTQELLGLFELDGTGKVLYYRTDSGGTPPEMTGHNFYDEVAHFERGGNTWNGDAEKPLSPVQPSHSSSHSCKIGEQRILTCAAAGLQRIGEFSHRRLDGDLIPDGHLGACTRIGRACVTTCRGGEAEGEKKDRAEIHAVVGLGGERKITVVACSVH